MLLQGNVANTNPSRHRSKVCGSIRVCSARDIGFDTSSNSMLPVNNQTLHTLGTAVPISDKGATRHFVIRGMMGLDG